MKKKDEIREADFEEIEEEIKEEEPKSEEKEKIEEVKEDVKEIKEEVEEKKEDVKEIKEEVEEKKEEPKVELEKPKSIEEKLKEEMANNQSHKITVGERYNIPEEKKNMNKLLLFAVIVFIVCIGVIAILIFSNKIDTKEKDNNSNKEQAELKYTDTATVKSEGVYITDVSEVVDNVMPSIVAITSKTRISSGQYGPSFWGRGNDNNSNNNYATGAGSGIIVSKTSTELLILTNNHVVDDADKLSVKFVNDKSYDATIKGKSSNKDIAIISIPLKDIDNETLEAIRIATLGDSKKLKVGEGVIAIGNALGYGQSVTTGVVSALDREVSIDGMTNSMIQTDAAINGGNSGGALLNSKGEVIGINSAKYSTSSYSSSSASIEGMGFAIPISNVEELIKKLMNGEQTTEETRGYLGVSGYMITSVYSEAYNMPEGFYISSIVKNSGADKAGLEIGNIITEIDGNKVKSFSTISEHLEDKKAKEKVTLKIKYISGREYKEKEITVSLSSYKEVN